MKTPRTTLDWVIVTLPPSIIIFGLLGNTFSVVILLRARFRRRSISLYLLALAILDSIFLLSCHPTAWTVDILFGVNYPALSDTACQVSQYITAWSRTSSAWVLVVLTVERMLAMSIPHLAQNFTSRRRAAISVFIVVLINGLVYIYSFFVFGKYPYGGKCYWRRSAETSRIHVLLSVFDFLLYMVIPSTIMATCNSVLLFLLYYSREVKQRTQTENKHIVITIVCVTMAFILLTSPMCLNNIIYLSGVKIDPPIWLFTVLYSLDLLNHAVNFMLYSISGPAFRSEIKSMFAVCVKCCRARTKKTGTASTNSTLVDTRSSQNSIHSVGRVIQGGSVATGRGHL